MDPATSTETPPSAARKPICVGEACRTRTAVSGRPSRVMRDPASEMVWPIQSFTKSLFRQSPVRAIGFGLVRALLVGAFRGIDADPFTDRDKGGYIDH